MLPLVLYMSSEGRSLINTDIFMLKCSTQGCFKAAELLCFFLPSVRKRRHTTSLVHKTRRKYLKTQLKLSRAAAVKNLGEYSGCFCFCKHYKTLLISENIPQQTRSGGKNLPEYSVSYFWKLWRFVFSAGTAELQVWLGSLPRRPF